MSNDLHEYYNRRPLPLATFLVMLTIAVPFSGRSHAQTPSTGALTGVAIDPTGAVLPEVVVRLSDQDTGTVRSVTSDKEGGSTFFCCPPAGTTYKLPKPAPVPSSPIQR